nr:hypothetical protein [Tanacetum cinerariifolium]
MANLSSVDLVYDVAGPSYDSDILSENTIIKNSLTTKLATYKEQVKLYEIRAKFELMEREQKINEQLRIIITDRNFKEETLKKELYSIKLQLASTINHNKLMVEEVMSLKKDFKQKENKYLEDFLDMKSLKEKVNDRLFKQDQSLQIVHMLCRPNPYYNKLNKVAIGYKNPLCLTRTNQVQPALYNGHEIIKDNHVPAIVHNIEDTLKIAKITRRKMNDKMKDPECVNHKVKIAPHDYSKENFLATFTPHKQLTLEQIFWSQYLIKMKTKAPKEQTTASRPIKAKHDEIEQRNLLIENDNLIAECLSKEVFYVATNFKLNVSRFTELHVANTIVEARCLELEAELSNLCDKSHNNNHNELVNHFSNLEAHHLNLQLKYQNLKDNFGNNQPTPAKETPNFNSVFIIEKMQASLQEKNNIIKQLKKQISHLQETRSESDRTLDIKALDSQFTQLTEKVTAFQSQNDLFWAENRKIKQHYKEFYDSIKITCAKHIEQVTALTNENINLKAQTLNNVNSVSKDHVTPTVFTPGKYAIDVEPIPPHLRNNREAHLNYLRHLKESVKTIREIVEEAKVVRPLDSSIIFACRYTKHSQELLEYATGTCPHDSHQRDKNMLLSL